MLEGIVRMSQVKVAITIEEGVLARVNARVRQHVFSDRSKAIQEAVQEKRGRLAAECAKLDPAFEKAMANEGLSEDFGGMAKILRGEIRWVDLNQTIGRKQSGEQPVLKC